jgi:peptidyl-prolyl cis-trans isomerase SurA
VQQTRARHILVRTNEVTSEAEAQRRLADLRERIVTGGADFAELARLHSADGSASKGGDLGWLLPGDTVPDFERAMDALKISEISRPVKSPFGYHLIQVQERRAAGLSEERKRMQARQTIKERKAEEAYQDWLRQLRDRTYVEMRLEDK